MCLVGVADGQATDMEICSGDSTPTSETSGGPQEGANAPGPPQQPLHVETIGLSVDPGPPTPTHSETQDCTDARKCKIDFIFIKWSYWFFKI